MNNIDLTIKRFMDKIIYDNETSCWNWLATKCFGYGYFGYKGKSLRAHRFIYELTKGLIPKGLVLDHLCRNKACVNPNHLEAVTQYENTSRGDFSNCGSNNRNKTHCVHGHEYNMTNTRIQHHQYGIGRVCRECDRIRSQKKRIQKASKGRISN